jgi:hypothetical protein
VSQYSPVTFLLCNPRSRSAWMNKVFAEVAVCGEHDPLRHMSSIAGDFREYVDGLLAKRHHPEQRVFIADSGAAMFTHRLAQTFPGARFLFVLRSPNDVALSLTKMGARPRLGPDTMFHKMLNDHSWLRKQGVDCMACAYSELDDFQSFSDILQYAVNGIMVEERYKMWLARNIQSDVDTHMDGVDPFKNEQLMREALQ